MPALKITTEQRIARLEEAFMLFCALVTGEPSDATEADKQAVQERYASIMTQMRDAFVSEASGQ